MRLRTAFLNGLTSPTLSDHWMGRMPFGGYPNDRDLKQHMWRTFWVCMGIAFVVGVGTLVYPFEGGASLSYRSWMADKIVVIPLALALLWAYVMNPMRYFLKDCVALAELIPTPGMLNFRDLESQSREILVLAAESVIIHERGVQSPSTNRHVQAARALFGEKHKVFSRFDLVSRQWDQYFDEARDRQRANTVRGA